MWSVAKKEFKSYFLSPIGYIYIGILLLTFSLFFYIDIFQNRVSDFTYIFGSTTTILTFITPVLTMRLFAEERKNGTEQILLTSPKSVTQIVLGKFLAVSMVCILSTALTLVYYVILSQFCELHLQSSLVAMLGFALLSIAYASFGMFASSLTENQIVAAVISVGFFLGLWFLPNIIPGMIKYSLIYTFYNSFICGTITIPGTILLISFAAMFIIFTIMTLQRRKNVK